MQSVPFHVGLNIVTLIMCILTLTLATAALMPQIKYGMVLLRDGLLWTILLGILLTVAFIGWSRLHEARQQRAQDREYYELQSAPQSTSKSTTGLLGAIGFDDSSAKQDRYATRDIVVESSFARPEEMQKFAEQRPVRPNPNARDAYRTRFTSDATPSRLQPVNPSRRRFQYSQR